MRPGRQAFTLLEVTLAMSALALLTLICYGAFHLGVRAMERGEVAVVSSQRLRAASDVLIHQIKSAVPYPACNEDAEVYPYFFGSATSMAFVTASGQLSGRGLARLTYQVVDNPTRLVVTESSFFSPDLLGAGTHEQPGGRSAVLLEGFRDLRFEYMMNDGIDTAWHGEWDGYEEEILPAAVRVLIEGLPGIDAEVWGQEIPIMAIFGDNIGEVDDEDLQECGEFTDVE